MSNVYLIKTGEENPQGKDKELNSTEAGIFGSESMDIGKVKDYETQKIKYVLSETEKRNYKKEFYNSYQM